MNEAHVVGAGPNGLAAAIVLQRAGWSVKVHERAASVGGAARSGEVTLPGFVHDMGAAVHPLGVTSPLFRSLPLADHGLEWVHPEVLLAHPLDGGGAVALHRSLDATCEGLGADGDAYRRIIGPVVDRWDGLENAVLGPILGWPQHPIQLTRFGIVAIQPATWITRRFETDAAKALFAGLAAHVPMPLNRFANTAVALVLVACGHRNGWPFAAGGSQSITDSLASYLESIGGRIETNDKVKNIDELGSGSTVLFDTDVRAAVGIAGDRVRPRLRRRLGGHRHGPGICKVDYALAAPVPWAAAACRSAGTVHLGGSAAEIGAAEREVWAGRIPDRPFVITAQPSRFDDSRAPDGRHVLWAYSRVPAGSSADISATIERQIDRFAPGFGDLVLHRHVTTARELEQWDPNLVGGDIAGGRTDRLRIIVRPRVALDPYRIGEGVFLCSSVAPPGPGVHGMAGYHAARSVLRFG